MKKSRYLDTLAPLVASGSSIRDACKIVNCSEATGYGLASTDEFRTLVAQIRSEVVQRAVGILTAASTKAATSLETLLDSKDEKIVLAASSKLLGILPGMQELAELRDRVSKIESQTSLRIAK